MVAAASLSTWLFAAEHYGHAPAGDFIPAQTSTTEAVAGPKGPALRDDAVTPAVRDDAFRRAAVRPDPADVPAFQPLDQPVLPCRFLRDAPSGTSPKFSCVLEGGQVVKVKYGSNPEIQAEVAASQLVRALGFAADDVTIVPRVRCYGCPRFPFITMQVLTLARATGVLGEHGYDDGYTDFEWAAVERKFPAQSIKTDTLEGWAWWELPGSQAPRADLDALRLLAVFLAHWDNKSGNQRLVCLDQGRRVQKDPAYDAAQQPCARPLLMIQDLGATFGPSKVNLVRWRELPIWADARRCRVSMHALPYRGATFTDAEISEAGRLHVSRHLAALDEGAVRRLFADARFPEFYSGTDDARDLDAWTTAFRSRVDQIVNAGPCPSASPAIASRE